ncbi:MAG: hypothetical protein HZB37_01535 [Planctomycetes bacterium]|nr:hypothetical protein [Planctomycetota bacterium]
MARTVFILGAGASKEAGAPLMKEFLDKAHDLHFSSVFKGIGVLQNVHSKAQLDIQNVESVFAAFEMARILGHFGGYSNEEINKLEKSMKKVIVATIQQTLLIPVVGKTVMAPPPYDLFLDLIQKIKGEIKLNQSVAIISFNYDMAIDYTFHRSGVPITYCLGEETRIGAIPVLKLHGSLNWVQCKECGAIVPWQLPKYFSKYSWQLFGEPKNVVLGIGSHLQTYKHGEHSVWEEPVVVPPTWNKYDYHNMLAKVWSSAAHELGEAENIFVIGYSLPPTDAFFRYLYALGTVGEAFLKRFWVFNPDSTGDVKERFRSLLVPGAQQRYYYSENNFDGAIHEIAHQFGIRVEHLCERTGT